MLENFGAPDFLEVINRGSEADSAGDVRRAAFKPVGRLFVGALFQGDADDHLSAAVPGRHGIEKFSTPVKRPDPGRRTHFVPGKNQEIAAELANIERHMSGALRAIHQGHRANFARLLAKLADRIDRAERVGNVGKGKELHFLGKQGG